MIERSTAAVAFSRGRGALMMARRCAAIALLLAACSRDRTPDIAVIGLDCTPAACGDSLRAYLRERPAARVVGVLPIETVGSPHDVLSVPGNLGTQRLYLLLANDGPYPLAEDLVVSEIDCGLDSPGVARVADCTHPLEALTPSRIRFWVPINAYPTPYALDPGVVLERATWRIVYVEERTSLRDQGRAAER